MADLQMSGLDDSLRVILRMWASETEARLEGEEHFFNIQTTGLGRTYRASRNGHQNGRVNI